MIVPRMLLKAAGFCKKAKYAKKIFNSYFKFFVSPCFKKANFLFLRWCPKNKSQRDEKFLQLFGKKRRTRTLFSNFSCSKKSIDCAVRQIWILNLYNLPVVRFTSCFGATYCNCASKFFKRPMIVRKSYYWLLSNYLITIHNS